MNDAPNGCRYSDLKVRPSDWEKSTANIKANWIIHFRFYTSDKKSIQIQKSGMNHLSTLRERKAATKELIRLIKERLEAGWNPLEKEVLKPVEEKQDTQDISHNSILFEAMEYAFKEKVKEVGKQQASDLKSLLKSLSFCPTAKQLKIGETRRKHALKILREIEAYKLLHGKKKAYTGDMFNKDRAHLQMLFKVLIKEETLDTNPIDEYIERRDVVRPVRPTLTREEREKVDAYLKEHHYNFWRYWRIFFHSGARSTELFRMQCKDVRIEKREFDVIVEKGRKPKRATKVIQLNALQLWADVMTNALPDHYVFSDNFVPGPKEKNPRNEVTKFFKKTVKKKLEINKDFYSLKHLHSNAIINALKNDYNNLETVMEVNSQESEETAGIYAYDAAQQELDRLKEVKIDILSSDILSKEEQKREALKEKLNIKF